MHGTKNKMRLRDLWNDPRRERLASQSLFHARSDSASWSVRQRKNVQEDSTKRSVNATQQLPITMNSITTPYHSAATSVDEEISAVEDRDGRQSIVMTQVGTDESSVASSLSAGDMLDYCDETLFLTDVIFEADPKLGLTLPKERSSFTCSLPKSTMSRRQVLREVDVESYMASREMTAKQELWNAITMVPSPLFCLFYILSGLWITPEIVPAIMHESQVDDDLQRLVEVGSGSASASAASVDLGDCLSPTWWHRMPALPPLPVVAVAVAVILHAPWSIVYHAKYAPSLPPGFARTNHWSRRMDQSFIHVASALTSYATSGSWDFFIANVVYNADCVYRQFERQVRPRRNQVRIVLSFLFYTLPIIKRGDLELFVGVWLIFVVGGWLFGAYPLGGWSHAAFHLVLAFLPPLLMTAACKLPASRDQMQLVAQCLAASQRRR